MFSKSVIRITLVVMVLLSSSVWTSSAQGLLTPDGTPGETYFAPFPVRLSLDGDWAIGLM